MEKELKIIVSDKAQRFLGMKREIEQMARSKDTPDHVKRLAWKALRPLNDLITEGLFATVEQAAADEHATNGAAKS